MVRNGLIYRKVMELTWALCPNRRGFRLIAPIRVFERDGRLSIMQLGEPVDLHVL